MKGNMSMQQTRHIHAHDKAQQCPVHGRYNPDVQITGYTYICMQSEKDKFALFASSLQ